MRNKEIELSQSQLRTPERVAVFGGAGNMGSLTTDLFRGLGFEPIVSDTRLPESPTPKEAVRDARVVFFSTPVEEIGKIIAETKDDFGADHVVIDNASSKRLVKEAFKLLDERGVSICSTHPLCKHDQPLHGQKVLIMEVGQNPIRARELAERLHRSAGMVTIPFSFENHDSSMLIPQLLPHVIMRAAAQELAERGVDMQALMGIATANAQLFNLSFWRTNVQAPEISATIIVNLLKDEEGLALVSGFRDTIDRMIRDREDAKALAQRFGEAVSLLDKNGLSARMNHTTTVVLERLANLEVGSLVLEVPEEANKPGLLRRILLPFEEQGINITATNDHLKEGKLRFEFGIDERTRDPVRLAKVAESLQELGYTVLQP